MPILGNITGLFIMSALSVLGLSAAILSSALVFEVVKVIGAAYLVYLGTKLWRSGFVPVGRNRAQNPVRANNKKAYFQGLAVALSNPKAIAFTTALFPQFIVPEGSLLVQFSLLVGTFMLLSFSCLLGYSLAVHHAKSRLFESGGGLVSKVFGVAFVASGAFLLTASRENA